MSRRPSNLALVILVIALTKSAVAANCPIEVLQPQGSHLQVKGIGDVYLGAADDDLRPTAWQGPISAGKCSLDLGIIEAPFMAARPGFLYVTTYSGSIRRVALVDVAACSIRWESKPFVGAVRADAQGLDLGSIRFTFDRHCVPQHQHQRP